MKKIQKRIIIGFVVLVLASVLGSMPIRHGERSAAAQEAAVAAAYPDLDSDRLGENYTIRDYAASEKTSETVDETITRIVPADYFSTVGETP